MRRTVLPLTVALVVAPLFVMAPAQAATPVIGALDSSTPGHVTGTVTSSTLFVRVELHANNQSHALSDEVLRPVIAGSATYDLETWGLTTGWVAARACSSTDPASCGAQVISSSFTPTDGIVPNVQFPADDTVGPNDTYQVTASDPNGGGKLWTVWHPDPTQIAERTLLAGGGAATTIPLDTDGADDLLVVRCSSFDSSICTSADQHAIEVDRKFTAWIQHPDFGWVNTTVNPIQPVIEVDGGQNFTYHWWVLDYATQQPIAGAEGTLTGLDLEPDGQLHPSVSIPGLTTGVGYSLMGTLSYDAPDFGGTKSVDLEEMTFGNDTVAPIITGISLSRGELLPFKDGYRDTVEITVHLPYSGPSLMYVDMLNATGDVVQRWEDPIPSSSTYYTWTGRDTAGHVVPAGTYAVRATLSDEAGNTTVKTQGSITVVRKKRVASTWTHTYSARGSMVRKWVGRCSTLASPSRHGWSGSLGYYSNSRCKKSLGASIVQTVHVARVPAAFSYAGLRIVVYGGAAREAPQSLAILEYLRTNGKWTQPGVLGSRVYSQRGPVLDGDALIFPDRSIAWTVFNGAGSRYDIKSFTVRLNLFNLVPE